MTNYLGGQTIVAAGWLGPQSVYVDFDSDYTTGWQWQLYANRTLIGITRLTTDRRIVGQLVTSGVPAPLTLLRVPSADVMTDFGATIPSGAWNRYLLSWTASSSDADLDHWDITAGAAPGDEPDPANVIARVPYYGDRDYSFVLPGLSQPGTWKFAVTPRDNAKPLGNAGTPVVVTIVAAVPPPDLAFSGDARFTAAVAAGVLTASFAYGG
jgi:hypothetical protein